MKFRTFTPALLSLLFACGLFLCDSSGEPPVLSDLTLSPSDIAVGTPTTVRASLRYGDPDGDILEVLFAIQGPGADVTQTLPITGDRGTAGQLQVDLQLTLPAAGMYEVTLRIRDANGNTSAPIRGTLRSS